MSAHLRAGGKEWKFVDLLTHWLSVRSPRKKRINLTTGLLTVTDILPESLPEDSLPEYPTYIVPEYLANKLPE